jgi:hypothetical protein
MSLLSLLCIATSLLRQHKLSAVNAGTSNQSLDLTFYLKICYRASVNGPIGWMRFELREGYNMAS